MQLRLNIAQLSIGITCSAADCVDGVGALTRLFLPSTDERQADISFDVCADKDGITLRADGESLWQGRDAGEVVAAFEWAFYHRTIAALYPRFLSLHASSVAFDGCGITCAGQSGSGKSSLCTAALLDGADYFSDEYTLLDEHGGIAAFPRPLQWGDTTHPAFSAADMHASGLFDKGSYAFTDRDGVHVTSLLWHPRRVARQPVTLHLLLLPRFDASAADVQCAPVPRSQALLELAAEMHHKLPAVERIRLLHQRIPDATRCMRVVFSDVRAVWREITRLL